MTEIIDSPAFPIVFPLKEHIDDPKRFGVKVENNWAKGGFKN
jgi:hypothetical protein